MIIAAGGGRRIGGPEALLRQGDKPLVNQMIDTMTEAGCEQIVVVLGAAAEQVQEAADLDKATVVINKAWGTGSARPSGPAWPPWVTRGSRRWWWSRSTCRV